MANNHTILEADDRQGPAASQTAGISVAGIIQHTASETAGLDALAAETAVTPAAFSPDREPNGYYWTKYNGLPALRPHDWFVVQIASQADEIFKDIRQRINKTFNNANDREDETISITEGMQAGLEAYLSERRKLNEMSWKRKLQGELDDACYQFCQAAKYYLDATERAQFLHKRGGDVSSDERITNLRNLSEACAYEGYAVATAVHAISDTGLKMNFANAAKRVADYSGRKLTEWYASRQQTDNTKLSTGNQAALLDIINMFKTRSA